jgi:hypothetical protein
MNNLTDESVIDLDRRNYYMQSYEFTMLGYLIDEEEFQVKPAVARVLQLYEVDVNVKQGRRNELFPPNPDEFEYKLFFTDTNDSLIDDAVDYKVNLSLVSTLNVDSWDVYINGDFYGSDIDLIQLNTKDLFQVNVTKSVVGQEATIIYEGKLL